MKLYTVLCVIFINGAANGAPSVNYLKRLYNLENSRVLFHDFIEDHNRKYESVAEYERRHAYFIENLKSINELNSEKNNPAYFGINQFSDYSVEEFKKTSLGLVIPDYANFNVTVLPYQSVTAPDSLDWREKNVVTPVKNQGRCGSCWAFSTVVALEGQFALKNQQLTSLSEQLLVDCDSGSNGCNGGWPAQALSFVQQLGGEMSESGYPYSGQQGQCRFNPSGVVTRVAGVFQVPQDENQVQQYLSQMGPLSIAIDASRCMHYQGGVDRPSQGECQGQVNHAVALVGYGNNGGVPFWAIKNSWGTAWGEQGYYYLARGQNACNVASNVVGAQVA